MTFAISLLLGEMAFPDSASSPTTSDTNLQQRRLGMLTNCRSRMESLDLAIDHLRLKTPAQVRLSDWDQSVEELRQDRLEISLEMDRFSSAYHVAGRIDGSTSAVLASVKRLEGKLANLRNKFGL